MTDNNTINQRRPLRIACRIITFLISLYFFTIDMNSQTSNMMLIPTNTTIPSTTLISKNTTTSKNSILFSSTLSNYLTLTHPSPTSTLTHYDPHFLGGFRNQHMRFVAFVHKAVQHNISQILLPSLRWGDVSQPGRSVPHEVLFDVVYWNKRAGEFGLPRLVRYDKFVLEKRKSNGEVVIPCFNVTSSMYSGLNEAHWRSKDIKLRQYSIWDYMGEPFDKYGHCKYTFDDMMQQSSSSSSDLGTHLVPHGGTKQAGRLWWEYDGLQSHRGKRDVGTGKHPDHLPLEQAIYKLLLPSLPIRRAIQESLDDAMKIRTSLSSSSSSLTTMINKPVVVALHPRIEHDMLLHKICSKFMPLNLTKIFDESIRTMPKFDLLFIAVSKALVHGKPPEKMKQNPELLQIALENMVTLDQARKYGVFGTKKGRRGIPILESGISTATKIKFPVMEASNTDGSNVVTAQSLGVTELVASVVNFFTVLQADAFVGVRGSTFSQDVMSVRYYRHLDRGGGSGDDDGGGENNFVVGPDGMRQLFGPAEPLPCK